MNIHAKVSPLIEEDGATNEDGKPKKTRFKSKIMKELSPC